MDGNDIQSSTMENSSSDVNNDQLMPSSSGASVTSGSNGTSTSQEKNTHPKRKSSTASPKGKKRKSSMRDELDNLSITCPICDQRVTGTESDVNHHVDLCVEEKERRERVEEYEWAGHSKIRTTYAEAFRIAGSGVIKINHDTPEDDFVDIRVDGDNPHESSYGPSQFTSEDLMRPTDNERSPSGDTECNGRLEMGDNKSSAESNASTESSNAKCAVCLDKLSNPVVSVICWHIHCESCWINSLKSKLLCPRCTLITTPDDLRRVYL